MTAVLADKSLNFIEQSARKEALTVCIFLFFLSASKIINKVTLLQRECDKLRSVLEQKAQNVASSPGARSPSNGSPRNDQDKHDKEVSHYCRKCFFF